MISANYAFRFWAKFSDCLFDRVFEGFGRESSRGLWKPRSPLLSKGLLGDFSICFNTIVDTHTQPAKQYCNDSEFVSASSAGQIKGSTAPSRACAPNQVKVFVWPGNMAKAVLVANLLHNILEDQKTREAPNPATISSRVSKVNNLRKTGYHTEGEDLQRLL